MVFGFSWLSGPMSGTLLGKDINEIFAYHAPKKVLVKDARLGLLQLLFIFGILMYIGCAYRSTCTLAPL